jgi:hypothetical protein
MPFVSPFLKKKCPHCLKYYHPSDCTVVATNEIDPNKKILYSPPSRGTFEYTRSRFYFELLTGPVYVSKAARRQCPHCNELLPEEGTEVQQSFNIAIAGDTFSGKTHYMVLLLHLLENGALTQASNPTIASWLDCLSPETETEFKRDFSDPILRDRKDPLGTPAGVLNPSGLITMKPLVYRLTLSSRDAYIQQSVILTFYDISGEDIADDTKIVQFGRNILEADAIIYLADPHAMPHLVDDLPMHLRPDPAKQTGRTTNKVLASILKRFEQYNKIQSGDEISIPIAIMIPKSDLLKYTIAPAEQHRYAFLHDVIYDGKAHPRAIQKVSAEVQERLHHYQEYGLLQQCQRFTNVCFFATSATGCSADQHGHYIHIKPHRCLDPLTWILWQLNVIEADSNS